MVTKQSGTITIPFILERETKGTCRYAEVEEDPSQYKIGTIYVKKGTLQLLSPQGGYPKGLQVTLTVV